MQNRRHFATNFAAPRARRENRYAILPPNPSLGSEMNRLSVCLITLNEERNLPRALCSIQGIADEIVVVDCGSRDRTQEIAREHGARVIARAWTNFAEQQNYAAAAASNDWIISMDAAEDQST